MDVREISAIRGLGALGNTSLTTAAGEPARAPERPRDTLGDVPTGVLPETYTRFIVNVRTGDVRVLVVDARSDQVVREIPPGELAELRAMGFVPPGYLFQVEV